MVHVHLEMLNTLYLIRLIIPFAVKSRFNYDFTFKEEKINENKEHLGFMYAMRVALLYI